MRNRGLEIRERLFGSASLIALCGVFAAGLSGAEPALAGCSTTGNGMFFNCSGSGVNIQPIDSLGTLDVSDLTINGNISYFPRFDSPETSFDLTLTVNNTTIVNPDYGAINLSTNKPNTSYTVVLGSDVSLTSTDGFGGLWVRNDVSGNIDITSGATITATGAPGIAAVTNQGSVTVDNSGHVTSTDNVGIYAEGGFNDTVPATVSVTNSAQVGSHLAGINVLNYLGTATIDNSGDVTSDTRQALVASSSEGDTLISNSGTVISNDYTAVEASSNKGLVTVENSGSITAHRAVSTASNNHQGVTAYSAEGNVVVTNTATGVITADADTGVYAQAVDGDVTITNYGTVSGTKGVVALATAGTVSITNTGEITGHGENAVLMNGATSLLNNSGTISTTGEIAVQQSGSGNATVIVSGTIEAGDATGKAIALGSGTNTVSLSDQAILVGRVTNISSNNTLELFGTSLGTLDLEQFEGFANIIKSGAGTWALSGSRTGTLGTITVSQGVLVGDTSSLQGNITNNAQVTFTQSTDGIYSGVMSGTGSLLKDGTGTLILTGTNTYTGGTTITAGTLQIGNGGADGSIVGNVDVQAGATLAFNRSGTYDFPGTITGTGDVTIAGGSTVNFLGASSYSGTINVSDASFILSPGAVSNSAYEIVNGGIISGSGTISGLTVGNGGTAAPGYSPGTLVVTGNVTFLTGSTYTVDVTPTGDHDLISATGTATITGGSVVVNATSGSYQPTTTVTILEAAGGVTGTFDSVTSNLAFLTPSLVYGANDVLLSLTRNAVGLADVAITRNQINAATALETLPANALYNAVLTLDAVTARQAYNQVSGEVHASAITGLMEDSRFVRDAVNNRLRTVFDGVGAGDQANAGNGGKTAGQDDASGSAFWSSAFGSWGKTKTDGNAAQLDRSTGGFLSGIDGWASDVRLGLFGGYSRSSFSTSSLGSADTDNYHAGAYVGMDLKALVLRGGTSYSWHDLDTSRSINFGGYSDSLTAGYHASTWQAFAELAAPMAFDGVRVEPFANLAHVKVRADGFTESGGLAALTSGDMSMDTTFATIGLRTVYAIDLGTIKGRLNSSLAWQHAAGDITPSRLASFAGASSFEAAGVGVGRNRAVVEAGINLDIDSRTTFGLSYVGQMSKDVQDHGVKAMLNVRF